MTLENSHMELIKQVLSGNNLAFEKIVDKYKNYIFAIVLNFTKDQEEVENIVQEVFLQIYISLPEYKFDNFKGWIGRIATNKAIDWKRKKKAKFNEIVVEDTEEIIYKIEGNFINMPEDILIGKERSEKINNICENLPDIYKKAIIKFYFEEKSYEEISVEENVSVKTVASRLYRAKNILKEKWREENETL
jgi:RNA polymerase sigma factor (sigma-70 family)